MMGYESDSKKLGQALARVNARIASCESCTAGSLADAISSAAGASAWFEVGAICYSERAKTLMAGVPETLFAFPGVVSREVAEAMAGGIAERGSCRFGVATTGLAGPGGAASPRGELAQGTVCLAAADALTGVRVSREVVYSGSRSLVREQATRDALALATQLVMAASMDE